MHTIWLSPTEYVTGDLSLKISYPSVTHSNTIVICKNDPGDFKWISMGLPLPPNVRIKQVQICYQVSNPQSFISQVRLAEMSAPNQVIVRHDDPTDLKSTSPTCYSSNVGGYAPIAAVTLELRLNFWNTADQILLGAVGVEFETNNLEIKGPRPWADVRAYGAKGDGATDDTDAIQATEDVAAAHNGIVLFPSGTYIVDGARYTIPGDSRKYGIKKRSNTKWVGSGYGSSIRKLKDNSTQDKNDLTKTVDPQMIYANAPLNDIGFYRLGFDLNGANNPIFTLGATNVAAIWFDGEDLEVHGMVVEECKFYNGPGATVILVQNRATSWSGHSSDYPLDDVLILNNCFEDNCLSPMTNDHSTMNIWARRTRVSGNIFQQTAVVPAHQRYLQPSAIEFHGGDGLFLGNVIRSYGTVVIASENFIEPWENFREQHGIRLGPVFNGHRSGDRPAYQAHRQDCCSWQPCRVQ